MITTGWGWLIVVCYEGEEGIGVGSSAKRKGLLLFFFFFFFLLLLLFRKEEKVDIIIRGRKGIQFGKVALRGRE